MKRAPKTVEEIVAENPIMGVDAANAAIKADLQRRINQSIADLAAVEQKYGVKFVAQVVIRGSQFGTEVVVIPQ